MYPPCGLDISFLTVVRRFQTTGSKVPVDSLGDIARWDLQVPEEELQEVVGECLSCGLLQLDEEGFVWSERRRNDLLQQEAKRARWREGAKKTNAKRWHPDGDGDDPGGGTPAEPPMAFKNNDEITFPMEYTNTPQEFHPDTDSEGYQRLKACRDRMCKPKARTV